MPSTIMNPQSENQVMPGKRYFVGVAGGTASGKTSVCKMVISLLKEQSGLQAPNVAILWGG